MLKKYSTESIFCKISKILKHKIDADNFATGSAYVPVSHDNLDGPLRKYCWVIVLTDSQPCDADAYGT